jgi:hypothetical protein
MRIADAIRRTIFPPSVFGFLGRLFGALSLIALMRHASAFGFSATFAIVLDIYEIALRNTVGLLDPTVRSLIDWLRDTFAISLPFSVGWRHIFVILQILFVRDAGTAFADGRRSLGVVRLVVGLAVAFSTAIFAFVADPARPVLANAILCVIPIVGLFVYDVIMYAFSATWFFHAVGLGELEGDKSRGSFFLTGLKRSIVRFLLVASASLLIFAFPWVRSLAFPHAGLLAMTVGLVANAAYWLVTGWAYSARQRLAGKSFRAAFLESESGRFGLSVLGILFWFGVFSSLNAGMRLLGF